MADFINMADIESNSKCRLVNKKITLTENISRYFEFDMYFIHPPLSLNHKM